MKKVLFIVVIFTILFAVFTFFISVRGNKEVRMNDFNGINIPKEWLILKVHSSKNSKIYKIYIKNFSPIMLMINDGVKTDVGSVEQTIENFKYKEMRIKEYEICKKSTIDGVKFYRFKRAGKNRYWHLIDVVVGKKSNKTVLAFYKRFNSDENMKYNLEAVKLVQSIEQKIN